MTVRTPRIYLALLVAAAGACNGPGEPTSPVPGPPAAPLTGAAPFLVSNPVSGTAASLLGSTADSRVDGVAYISLPPGTVPGGLHASIRVDRTGLVVVRALVDGGLDPVPVRAAVGDTITLTLARAAAAPEVLRFTVPAKKPPVIVRTVPPRNKRDVPLNARMVVVFSEPIDARTLNAQSFTVLDGTAPIPGSVAFTTGEQTTAEFTPDSELHGSTDYELVVTQDITDRDGAALESPGRIAFSTEPARFGELVMIIHVTGAEFAPSAFTVSVDGGSPRSITAGENATATGIAPGTRLVTVGGLNANCAVGGPATRSVVVVIGQATPVSWNITCTAAAARQLAFVRDGAIHVANADGSGIVRLTDPEPFVVHYDPAWSPDGTRIAYSRSVGDTMTGAQQDIYIMNANGSNKARFTTQGTNSGNPTWSPDGQFVAFDSHQNSAGGQDVYVKSVTGAGAETRITATPGWDAHPAWSPDGRQIIYSSDQRAYDFLVDLFVISPDGSGGRSLVEGPFPNGNLLFHYQATWSPDGQQIAMVVCSYTQGPECFSGSEIAVANPDGTGVKVVARSLGFAKPSWSRDGRMIAFGEWTCPACTPSIRFVQVDGSGEGLLIANGHSPAWRP